MNNASQLDGAAFIDVILATAEDGRGRYRNADVVMVS